LEQQGIEPTEELLICLGEKSQESELTRDEKRKRDIRVVEKVAQFQKNERLTEKYTTKELVDFAEKESSSNGSSGDKLPLNSSEKYKIVNDLLNGTKYDFTVLLFAEGLYRVDVNNTIVESETKRIIDRVDEIVVVGNEIEKLSEIQDYAISLGKTISIYNGDVIEKCEKELLDGDDRKGFVYVNGASLYSQRPEFMNYLKKKYPESVIAMVVVDYLFGKSQVCGNDRLREITTVYSGAKDFNDVIDECKKRVKFLKTRKYAETPQEKYVFFI